jgi:hypothetical protein
MEKADIKGKVRFIVRGPDGKIKRYEPTFWEKVMGKKGRQMDVTVRNAITNTGDAYCAQQTGSTVTTDIKIFDNANSRIVVGTGWTGTAIKTNDWVNTAATSAPVRSVSTGYPQLNTALGSTGDNTIIYRSTYSAGLLSSTDALDEAALVNIASTTGTEQSFAYAQISPNVTVTSDDTLQVDWSITFLGAT